MYWVETFFYTQNIKLWSGRGLQMLSDASLEPSLGHHTCLRHHRCLLSIILEAYFTFSEKKETSVSLPLALENLLKLEFHLRSFFLYYLWWTFMESIHALCEHFHTEILRLSLSPHLTEQIPVLQLAFSLFTGLLHYSQKFMVHQTGHGASPKVFIRSN